MKQVIEPVSQTSIKYIFWRTKAEHIARHLSKAIATRQGVTTATLEEKQALWESGLKLSPDEVATISAHARCEWADLLILAALNRVVLKYRRLVGRFKRKPVVSTSPRYPRVPTARVLTDGAGKSYWRCPISRQIFNRADDCYAHTAGIIADQCSLGLVTATTGIRQLHYQRTHKAPEPISEMTDFRGRPIEVGKTIVVDLATVDNRQMAVGHMQSIERASDGALVATCRMSPYTSGGKLVGTRTVQLFSDQLARRLDRERDYYRTRGGAE